MKISKESTFQPVTIVLEKECEVEAMKNILKYLQSLENESSPYGCGSRYTYRFNSLSDGGRKMYYSLKSGL